MESAVEQARQGNLAYFQSLSPEELTRLQGSRDEDGRVLLHAAAAGGSLELCQFLYDHGGNAGLNQQDDEGWAPLHTAVSTGHQSVAECLISCGAEVNLANSGGRTALHYAASKGHPGLVRSLCQSRADVHAKDMTGSTPLHRAASAGKEEAVRALIEVGKSRLEAQDKEGNTPLLLAVTGGNKNLALYLAQLGADLEAANKAGETPLSMAGDLEPALRAAVSRGAMEEDE